jgi:hypothetical protein
VVCKVQTSFVLCFVGKDFMKKINKRYFNFIFALFMSILMSGMMTLCITIYQFGFVDDVLMKFLGAWRFSFPFAFVISQGITPFVRKITMCIVEG